LDGVSAGGFLIFVKYRGMAACGGVQNYWKSPPTEPSQTPKGVCGGLLRRGASRNSFARPQADLPRLFSVFKEVKCRNPAFGFWCRVL